MASPFTPPPPPPPEKEKRPKISKFPRFLGVADVVITKWGKTKDRKDNKRYPNLNTIVYQRYIVSATPRNTQNFRG